MKQILISIVTFLISIQIWAWGSLAHKASSIIAWNFLDQETRTKLSVLLNGTSLNDASIWADEVRYNSEFKHTSWYHFEKVPDNFSYLQNLNRMDSTYRIKGGLIEALFIAEDIMKDPSSNLREKSNAIKFVIHFVSDIHQPLHTGRIEDVSGNAIPMIWQGRETNLHSVWDSQIIYSAYDKKLRASFYTPEDFYANHLMNKFKAMPITSDLFMRYDDWMHESMVPRADAYDHRFENEMVYTRRFIDIIDKRVYLAGLRIAFTLKRIIAMQKEEKRRRQVDPLQTLRESIVEIIGDFTKFVSLKPKSIIVF